MLRSSSLIFILGIALLISSCTKSQSPAATPDNPSGKNIGARSNIYVEDCGGDGSIKVIDPKASWKVPNEASISMYACLRDQPTKQPMRGHHFEIEDPATGKRYSPDCPADQPNCTSDASGCIKWHEPLPFNYYAKKSGTLELVRKLIATGIGSYDTMSWYVNPWAMDNNNKRDNGDSVKCAKKMAPPPDLIPASNPKAQASLLSSDGDGGAQLWMDEVDFEIINRQRYGEGQLLEFKLSGKPKVKWIDHNGKPDFQEITSGEFEVYAHLVATDTGPGQNEKMILTAGEMSTYAKVNDGRLLTTLRTSLERKTSIGNMTVVLKLIPRNYGGSRPLHEFEAVYELNSVQGFSDRKTGTLLRSCVEDDPQSKAECNYENFLKDADNYERFKTLQIAYQNKPLSFSTIKLRFVTIAAYPAETATRRTVTYSASTCLTDRSTGSRMAHIPFIIEYVDETGQPENTPDEKGNALEASYRKQKLLTDDEGCLRWMAHVAHDYYKQEEFVIKNVRIYMLNSDPVKIEPDRFALPKYDKDGKRIVETTVQKTPAGETLTFLLNPWDDKFTFGFDKREVSDSFLTETADRLKPESRFFTGGYGYHTLGFRYNIDRYMNLEVKKTILLEVDPRVLRYSGIVNARRTTENLRDGIYLLKVGIEKSFLDPSTPGVQIYPDPESKDRATVRPNSQDDPDEKSVVPTHEYISTKTTLVRVVDGRLIKPIELTMKDLRLMRIRSNFMIELELVDERKLTVDKALRDDLRERYGIDYDEVQKYRDTGKCLDEEVCNNDYLKNHKEDYDGHGVEVLKSALRKRRNETTAKLEAVYNAYSQKFNKDSNDIDDKKIASQDLLSKLNETLKTNDFTQMTLPDCDQDRDHCDRFLEKDDKGEIDNPITKPWLKRRTFVGPVIFLSNGYSDAVRPTDNLDDICREDNRFLDDEQRKTLGIFTPSKVFYNAPGISRPKKKKDKGDQSDEEDEDDSPGEGELFALEPDKDMGGLKALPKGVDLSFVTPRQNKDYQYWPYFGRLTNFCGRQVDYFIKKEKDLRDQYLEYMENSSKIEAFVKQNNLDFAVLNDYNKNEYTSDENRLSLDAIVAQMTAGSSQPVNPSNVYSLLTRFDREKATASEIEPICNLLVNQAMERIKGLVRTQTGSGLTGKLAEEYKSTFGSNYPIDHPEWFKDPLLAICKNHAREPEPESASLVIEKKLRIYETGSNYTFKGGLQINLNVGQTFSVSRGSSQSAGFEAVDYLDTLVGGGIGYLIGGPVGGVVGGLLVKPFSIKPGIKMDDSEGTNIAEQTYLVGQIAKFDVELKQYENCRTIRLNPGVLSRLIFFGMGVDPKMENKNGTTFENLLSRGLMVCDGVKAPQPIKVPEDYFYFTQHFTEGDMLDQADLLNHPWLMQIRGDRDFGNFIRLMNAQEDVSWQNFYKGAVGGHGAKRAPDWPLEKLADVFKATTPTFPGIYTVVPKGLEKVTGFPIEDRIIKIGRVDHDINGENCNVPQNCPSQYHGYRTEMQFMNSGGQEMQNPSAPPQ